MADESPSDISHDFPPPAAGMDPAFRALSLLRRRRLDSCVAQCTELLNTNAFDLQAWYLKTRALTLQSWVDETEAEGDGVAELLLDDNAVAAAPRPGTSLARPLTTSGGGGLASRAGGGVMRPNSMAGGRPQSGFARPGTGMRTGMGSRAGGGVEGAFRGARPGTMRPVTTSGRFVRLGTASMAPQGGGGRIGGDGGGGEGGGASGGGADPNAPFIDAASMDLAKYATRPALAKALCDYILYVDRNPKLALDLCSHATAHSKFTDWWWKARLGRCYYQLGLLRDAEQQFRSALKQQENIETVLELGKVFHRLDQPLTALELFGEASQRNPRDHHLLLGIARIHDQLNDPVHAVAYYTNVLDLDASNVEAIACVGASYFYDDQPEIALRTYRRLLQMGVSSPELWNNLGLSCFYASQYDMALSCLQRALAVADDSSAADVWYNIGHVALGIGDINLAYQAYKVSCSLDPHHAEAANNLAILDLRKGDGAMARNNLAAVAAMGGDSASLHEPHYNLALLSYKAGEYQSAFQSVCRALEACPDHCESLELKKMLKESFTAL